MNDETKENLAWRFLSFEREIVREHGMAKKKVVGIAGRFGARYGSSLRKRWKEVMERRYQEYECPKCKKKSILERPAVGIWRCPKCGYTWAGGAYVPFTEIGRVSSAGGKRT